MRIANLSVLLASAMVFVLIVPGLSTATGSPPEISEPPIQWEKVDESIRDRLSDLAGEESVEFILRLSETASLEDIKFQREPVVQRLKTTAATSQASLLPHLEGLGFEVKRSFWVSNSLLVEGPAHQLAKLTALPDVARIVDNFEVHMLGDGLRASQAEPSAALTWGLERVGADQIWSNLGVQGEDVRVCVSDTGVDMDHPDLMGKMWSDVPGHPQYPGGWIEFDFGGNPVPGSTPHDTQGHGTHTSGTVLGGAASGTAIGMAPEATLMHALTLPGGGGSFSQVIAGIEWCVDPHDENLNPAGQPAHVHSMSWGASGYYDEMIDPIRNSYFAGTLPVAAAGNCGEGCTDSPGNVYEALGIGASDVDELIAGFSSGEVVRRSDWGAPPADWPEEWVVPLLSAPGVDVYSSLPGGGYGLMSGTSMATPHVAGCAALMLSANPDLTFEVIQEALVAPAVWYNTYYPTPPDTRYGWGRLDCFSSVESVAYNSGIMGTISDQADGEAVAQAQVSVNGPGVQRSVESDGAGLFKISLKPGTYNLSVDRFGYLPQNVTDLVVSEDQWVNLDLFLSPLPRGNITGSAINNGTGIAIPGVTISLLGIPVTMASTTDQTGAYAILKVPEGSYDLLASSPYFKNLKVDGIVVVSGSNSTANFPMEPREWVAVIGDEGDALSQLLRENDYYVENPDWWQVTNDACRYGTVVVNHEYVDSFTLDNFLTALDTAGTGAIFLDTWAHTWTWGGIYSLWYHRSDPAERYSGYDTAADSLYYNVTQSHPILGSYGPGDVILFENSTLWHDYAWFDTYSGENGTIIALAGSDWQGDMGPGIAVDQRANNRHVLLSLHGASSYVQPRDWSDPATEIFLNAVNWSRGTSCSRPVMVDYELTVDPPVGMWFDTFQVSIRAINVGNSTGNYTARLYVDDWPQGEQTVSLLPGEMTTVTFNVARDPVGIYRVAIGPHKSTFRVRPPAVRVEAQDLDGVPLPGAAVTVGWGTSILKMGETDGNGTLTFDSPAGSHGQYWIVLHSVGAGAPHYFLAKNPFIEYDTVTSFLPNVNNTATLDVEMKEVVGGQTGVVYLRRTDMPVEFANAYAYPQGVIKVDRTAYSVWTLITVETLRSTWTYRSTPVPVDLSSAPTAAFGFAGHLKPEVRWTQIGTTVSAEWNVTDAYGNEIEEVVQKNVGILSAGETNYHLPFLSLWNAQGDPLAAGYVAWSQKPANVTLPENETVAFIQMDLETGIYPFDNTFELVTEVLDSGGAQLPKAAATADVAVEVRGTILLSGQPIPANLTINDVPVAVASNGTFSLTVNLTKGINLINVTAKDLAGNEDSEVFVIISKPDILLMVSSLPEIINTSQVEIRGMVEQGALLTVNGEEVPPEENGSFQVTVTLSEGLNAIVVAAEDYLGNTKEVTQEVVLDTVQPELTIVTPSSGHRTMDENITIVGSTEPTATLTINGQPVALDQGEFVYTAALQEGENSILIEARDPAGNVRETSLIVHREALILGAPVTYLLYVIPAVAVAAAAITAYVWIRRKSRTAQEPVSEEAQEVLLEEAQE